MITIVETIRGISEWIEENFGEPPTTKDVTEGFDRPCTYVQPVDLSASRDSDLRVEEYSFEIIRFAQRSDRGYLELLEYQKKFTELLEHPIPVSKMFLLYPEDVEFELRRDEMLLITSFAVTNIQLVTEESGESDLTMEELELDMKEEE